MRVRRHERQFYNGNTLTWLDALLDCLRGMTCILKSENRLVEYLWCQMVLGQGYDVM
jgi:hypothetical protein